MERLCDLTPEHIHRIAATPQRQRLLLIMVGMSIPIIAQFTAVTTVPEAAFASGQWARIAVDASAGYLPVIERFQLGGDLLYRHAFAHLVGFWAAVIGFLIAMCNPTLQFVTFLVWGQTYRAKRHGKSFSVFSLVWPFVLVLFIALVALFFAAAGTQDIYVPGSDLNRGERFLLFLLQVPWLHAIVFGMGWGTAVVALRSVIAFCPHYHRLPGLSDLLEREGLTQYLPRHYVGAPH